MSQPHLRFCATPGCARRVPKGHCPRHAQVRGEGPWARRPIDDNARLRGRRWMTIRSLIISEEPHCALCGGWGHHDDEVDHIDSDKTNNARTNLRRVHRECHKRKSHRESMRGRG